MLKFPKKRPPYLGTDVPADKSRIQVEQMLYSYGAEAVSVSTRADGRAQLRFIMEVPSTTERGASKKVEVLIEPPVIQKIVKTWDANRGKAVEQLLPHHAASWRLVFYYVKSKMDALAAGLSDFEKEFLAETVVRDRTGRETTVGRLVIPHIGHGEHLALETPDGPVAEPTIVERGP